MLATSEGDKFYIELILAFIDIGPLGILVAHPLYFRGILSFDLNKLIRES